MNQDFFSQQKKLKHGEYQSIGSSNINGIYHKQHFKMRISAKIPVNGWPNPNAFQLKTMCTSKFKLIKVPVQKEIAKLIDSGQKLHKKDTDRRTF